MIVHFSMKRKIFEATNLSLYKKVLLGTITPHTLMFYTDYHNTTVAPL